MPTTPDSARSRDFTSQVRSHAESALARPRTLLARSLRAKVAGDDAASRAQTIWGRSGQRWFSETDPVWRVHADASMFVGGVTALLLQSLHPLAMAGVAGHSGYKGDPWGRLQRTSYFLASTTFGTTTDAERTIAKIRGIHKRVSGLADDGTPYRASDPHLLKWVHVAEADSFLRAYQAYGDTPLTPAEADTYVRQGSIVATKLGVLDAPQSAAELAEQLASYRNELRVTPAAREAARFLLLTPPLPMAARGGYSMLAAGGLALLPRWARRELGIPAPLGVDALVARPLGRSAAKIVRWAMADPVIATDRGGELRPS